MTNERNINRPTDTDAALDQVLALAEPTPSSPGLESTLLDLASGVSLDRPPASPHLRSAILAAIAKQPQSGVQQGASVVQFRARQSNNIYTRPSQWAAGGLMAASVVLGLWLGNAGITDTYLRPTLSVVGLAQPDDDQLFTSDDYLGLGTADTNGEVM